MSDAWRRLDLATLRLVVVLDTIADDLVAERAQDAVAGGATMLQLRLKDENARALVEVARRVIGVAGAVPVIVSGRADVALAAGAAGVHLGIGDVPPSALRPVVAPGFLVGASHVEEAERDPVDVDYVVAGPVFGGEGALGVEGLARIVRASAVPVVALGGITPGDVRVVLSSGAAGIAVLSGFPGGPDPTRRVRAFRDALDASGR